MKDWKVNKGSVFIPCVYSSTDTAFNRLLWPDVKREENNSTGCSPVILKVASQLN